MLILHGLEGSSERSYVRILMSALARHGLHAYALNFRGCSGEPNRLARAYHSGETDDAAFAIERVRTLHPEQLVAAVGFSLGGNVLLKYLGERGPDSPLASAVAVSVPFDLYAGVQALRIGIPGRLYTHYFLRSLKGKLRAKAQLLSDSMLTRGLAARDLEQFDDAVTAPLHGFEGAHDYYERCSSARFLDRVETPTLLLQSLDDPFLPRAAVPTDVIRRNRALIFVASEQGGHLGFLERAQTPGNRVGSGLRFWAENEAARFVAERITSLLAG